VSIGDTMSSKKKAAIIGFGGMGQRHFKAYEKIGVKVVAIADLYSEKIKEILPNFPEDGIYKDYRDLFRKEDIDVVSVVTNGPTHAQITIAASETGIKNIMCEKPMATKLSDAEAIIRTITKNKTRLAVNHTRRHSSNYARLKEMIRNGIIGDIRHLYFNCGSTGIGNNAIHFFDTARYLTESEAQWALGFIDRTGTPNPRGKQFADPGGYGFIEFRSGTRFFVDTSEDTGVQYSFQIVGTYGRIIIDELNDVWEIRARNDNAKQLPLTRYGSDMIKIPFKSDGPFDIVNLTSLGLAELVSEKPISCVASDGKKSLEMVIAFHISDEAGNTKVNFPLSNQNLGKEIKIA
jgi:predicted dehydrogenase